MISLSFVMWGVGLSLTAGTAAVAAAVATRMKVAKLEDDIEEFQEWRREHRQLHKEELAEFHKLDKTVASMRVEKT